ncbi:hypothetical protein H6504_00380 [Candidatus Woesearchaeota archaeon]|nr:hypothetical protein [Candidatus Woesearchaeota archaeon]
MGYDSGKTPIDCIPIFLLHAIKEDHTLLIADEFVRMNGDPFVQEGIENVRRTIVNCERLFQIEIDQRYCSDFMATEQYSTEFKRVLDSAKKNDLVELIEATIPSSRKQNKDALLYPYHEIACVSYLAQEGYHLKIGPRKEVQYDSIMQDMGIKMSYAYLADAFALATKFADPVVHYISSSRGPNNGQRLHLGDSEQTAKSRLQGNDTALRYYANIASICGQVLGNGYIDKQELEKLYGKKLRKTATKLVLDNIIKPYNEVSR